MQSISGPKMEDTKDHVRSCVIWIYDLHSDSLIEMEDPKFRKLIDTDGSFCMEVWI